jgi:type II secretory pathway pseudopilin PulG
MGRIRQNEKGISFVEMIVAMAITAMVGSLLVAAFSMMNRVDRFSQQDTEALADLRTAAERFQKEMRQARKVYDTVNAPASTSVLVHFWVDYNRDNQQNLAERLIWRFETASGGKMRLVRTSEAGDSRIQATNLVSGSSFTYSPAPPGTTLVTLTLRADVSSGDQPSPRTVRTKVRLRNATA